MSLDKDIQTFFRAEPHNDFYNGVSGKMFPGEAPQGTSRPYSVLSSHPGQPLYDVNRKATETTIRQLDIYADTDAEIEELYKEAKALFDNAKIPVTDFTEFVQCRRIMNHKITEDGIKRYIVQYQIKVGE